MAELLDHDFDGIQEYDNPVPTWLSALFIISTLAGIAYAVYYPSIPNVDGLSGWTQAGQYEQQMAREEERYAPMKAEAEKQALEMLAAMSNDPATIAAGKEIFAVRCAACHGMDAEGRVGPSLIDYEWFYGSTPKDILHSIREGRPKGMPAWKVELNAEEIQSVTAYVLSLVKSEEESK